MLQGFAAAAASAMLYEKKAQSAEKTPAFLIVLGASGGASIIDSFLAIRESESANGKSLNTFADSEVLDIAGSPLRAVDLARKNIGPIPIGFSANQSSFVKKHKSDMLVATLTGTSVNHGVAEERARNGNGAWSGRTLEECVALEYGKGLPLPNVNMATGGFSKRGVDESLPSWAYAAPVAAPQLWPFSLDGVRGVPNAPSQSLVDAARSLRDGTLEPGSSFGKAFNGAGALSLWKQQRADGRTKIEGADLIDQLGLFTDSAATPLGAYGLKASEDAALIQSTFPSLLTDDLEAQAALTYLLLKGRVSAAVTIAPTTSVLIDNQAIKNPPLAFDFSHNAHRATQALMWSRILGTADRLITLLKGTELTPGSGVSMWDRTMIYVATDFGRSKQRATGADEFGTGHDLNNGVLMISPMLKGNRVLGGVDRDTGLTYGFDPQTGAPDKGRTTAEAELFSGILNVLDVDTSSANLPSVAAFK
jgi:hypothetical protein